ncbi:MAG TPA: hypothetical protein PLW09_12305, partial [Candidatus Kapabacteria bacterium]|nr:hypothetical protein [Candidatus Kapabacteria bacterium]
FPPCPFRQAHQPKLNDRLTHLNEKPTPSCGHPSDGWDEIHRVMESLDMNLWNQLYEQRMFCSSVKL